jgi:cell division protein FtsZ
MENAGEAWLSVAESRGQGRAVEAAREAVCSPLLIGNIKGAKRVLFTITGAGNLTLAEVNQAADVIRNEVAEEANVIFGVNLNSTLDDEVRLVLIATGFASTADVAQKERDKELHHYLKEMDDSQLDMPTFARLPSTLRHDKRWA